MLNCKLCKTPCLPSSRLSCIDGLPLPDPSPYRSLVVAFNILPFLGLTLHLPWIMFVNSCTPQLIFIWLLLNTSSDFSESPLTMVFYFNLVLLSLFAYTDADPAGDTSDRRSISGFIVFLAHNCITWSAKMRTTMSRSSTEAEYHSLASTVVALCWLEWILECIPFTRNLHLVW